jgi:hypothetical protein
VKLKLRAPDQELLSPNGAVQAAADSTERDAEHEDEEDDHELHEEDDHEMHDDELCETDDEGGELDTEGRCRKRKRRILFSKTQTYELERRSVESVIVYEVILQTY